MILAIETATRVCSVALFNETGVLGVNESAEVNAHSKILHVLIEQLLSAHGVAPGSLEAVAVSKGPGSYTGLRIGVSAAKGLCYAKDLPLIGVNTLESMAYGIKEQPASAIPAGGVTGKRPLLYIPMIDARRMEVYCAVYDELMNPVTEATAEVITADSFAGYDHHTLLIAGDGAAKCRELLKRENIRFLTDEFNTSARYMHPAAMKAFNEKRFENTAYFEPFYLKDFIAGKPRVKGLE